MRAKYITDCGVTYRIRGGYTATQLREMYKRFVDEVDAHAMKPEHRTKLTFSGWLVGFGKVSHRVAK